VHSSKKAKLFEMTVRLAQSKFPLSIPISLLFAILFLAI